MTIAQNSSRAEVWEFTRKPAEVLSGAFRQGQFQVLPLNKTDAAQRGELWADVNGDGRPDLLVAEPESGQISVYLQQADGALAPPKTFPSLAGVSQLAAADWNGDGHPEIFMLSQSERAVGVTEFDADGRLPFPTLIPLDGKPLAMAVGALKPGANPSLCVIVDKDGHRSLVTQTADGKSRTQKLSDSFKSNPAALAIHDVNQDGLADLVILIPYEKIKVLLQNPGGDFDEEDVDPPGGAIDQPWLASADVDGNGKPELLLPQKNFVRAVVLEQEARAPGATNKPSWVFRVKDQINGAASDSRIVGATAVMNGATQERNRAFHFPAGRGAPAVDAVRARHERRLARDAQRGIAGRGFQQPANRHARRRSPGQDPKRGAAGPERRRLAAAGGRRLGFHRPRRLRHAHQGRLSERRGGRRPDRQRAEGFDFHGNGEKQSGPSPL